LNLDDDHPAVSRRIGELLATAVPHAEMTAASSGEQGLALVAERTFDLVLLDLRLPGCGGITTSNKPSCHFRRSANIKTHSPFGARNLPALNSRQRRP